MADTFTGSIQTHKQNKYTLSRPRTRANTPALTPRGAHMYRTTTPVRLRWFRCDWVTLRRRRPCRQQSCLRGRRAPYSIEVNGAPDHALSRVTMHPPAAAAPRLKRAAEKALFRLENDVGAHRELGWTHACRHSRLNSHCGVRAVPASRRHEGPRGVTTGALTRLHATIVLGLWTHRAGSL